MAQSKQRILITGATGLVGTPLCAALRARGHSVRRLSRGAKGDYSWDVSAGQIDPAALNGVDVVIHLAGESVAQRWNTAAKERILRSRVYARQLVFSAAIHHGIVTA